MKWIKRLFLVTLALSLTISACKKEKDDSPSPTPPTPIPPTPSGNTPKNLGWNGGDNPNSVPTSVTNTPVFNSGTLPTSVSLLPQFPPIGDQGQYGTCVAWAAGYNMKTVIRKTSLGLVCLFVFVRSLELRFCWIASITVFIL